MIALQLYETIVGEGGINPEYFLHKMQWWEINRFLSGLRRRYHAQFEATRILQWQLACMFHDKKQGPPPQSPTDMYKFGWEEKEEQPPQMTDEEVAEMQDLISGFSWGN